MTATSDMILERRRIRRRLTFWRVLAVVAVLAFLAVLLPWPGGGPVRDHVARIWIDGLITADDDREARLREIAEDDSARALIVRINSPGGTVVASEILYQNLRDIAEVKPVVAVMASAAASGGYITALAADRIIAHGNTITGSIGVVAEVPNFAGLLDSLGIEVTQVKSAPLKGEPSLFTEPAPGAFEAQDALVEDMFGWFKTLVAERRGMDAAAVEEVANGRAYTGRQALALGLIDAIGDEDAALEWLAEEHGIDLGTPRDWRWDEDRLPLPFFDFGGAAARLLGLERPLMTPVPQLFAVMQ